MGIAAGLCAEQNLKAFLGQARVGLDVPGYTVLISLPWSETYILVLGQNQTDLQRTAAKAATSRQLPGKSPLPALPILPPLSDQTLQVPWPPQPAGSLSLLAGRILLKWTPLCNTGDMSTNNHHGFKSQWQTTSFRYLYNKINLVQLSWGQMCAIDHVLFENLA